MDYNYLIVVSLHFRSFQQLTHYKNCGMEFNCCGKKSESASAILCVTDGLIG